MVPGLKYLLRTFLIYSALAWGAETPSYAPRWSSWNALPLGEGARKALLAGKVVVHMEVDDFTRKEERYQKLNYQVAAWHPRPCGQALRRLSRYEEFKHQLDFVKRSEYREEDQEIVLFIDHDLFPIQFFLQFNIPRIKKPGSYPFSFKQGFLKGLTGTIHTLEHENRCILFTEASWEGPHSGFPNLILRVFATTASRLAMEKMLRVTR